MFSEAYMSNTDARSFPKGIQARTPRIVFVFLTMLYWLDTVILCDPVDPKPAASRRLIRFPPGH